MVTECTSSRKPTTSQNFRFFNKAIHVKLMKISYLVLTSINARQLEGSAFRKSGDSVPEVLWLKLDCSENLRQSY